MKGIIFNLVEDAVAEQHGAATWDALLDRAGVAGGYTSLGNYPDTELHALVRAGSELLGVPPEELLRILGHSATLGLAERYPHFFTPHEHTREFLLTLNDVIHPEVRKLHAEARPPDFWFETPDAGLVVHYRSERRLCSLAEGMMQGAATYFGETISCRHDACMHHGAAHCTMTCTFDRTPATSP